MASFLIYSGFLLLGVPGSPGGESLFFASPKKSNQKKGDPQSGPLCGSLKKLKVPENLETSRPCRRRTSKFFIRHFQLFQAQPGRVKKLNSGSDFLPLLLGEGCPNPNSFLNPVLAGLRSAGGSGSKFLDVRRLQGRLVSKNSAAFEHRKLPVAQRRDPDCGSPFLLLTLLLAKQKKSELPPGNSRQLRESETLRTQELLTPILID